MRGLDVAVARCRFQRATAVIRFLQVLCLLIKLRRFLPSISLLARSQNKHLLIFLVQFLVLLLNLILKSIYRLFTVLYLVLQICSIVIGDLQLALKLFHNLEVVILPLFALVELLFQIDEILE